MTTRRRSTTALAAGSATGGVLAYVFFAIVTQSLGSTAAAPVSVLWAYWSFAGAALTFPLQHWIARSVEAHDGEASVRQSLTRVAGLTVLVALAATTVSWLVRDALFHSRESAFPFLVGLVTLGAALMGITRGVLTARRRFMAVGLGIVMENAIRCVVALVLAVAGVQDPAAYGLALLAGYGAVAIWPSAFRLSRTGAATMDSPVAFLGTTAGGQLIGQVVLTGGPVLLALAGGAPQEVTALFAGLALFRAPYTLALGLVAQLTGWLTRLVRQRRYDELRKVRRWVVLLVVVGACGAAIVGAFVGPPLLRLIFGDDVRLAGSLAAVLAVGSTVALANLVTTVGIIAQGRTSTLVRSWALSLVPGALFFVVADASALDRTSWTFLVTEVAALVLLLREEATGSARARRRHPSGA